MSTGPSSSELEIDLSKEAVRRKPPSPEKLHQGDQEGKAFLVGKISSAAEKHGIEGINPEEIADSMMGSGSQGDYKTSSDFDPEHPWGPEAAGGALPETHIPEEAIVNLLNFEAGHDQLWLEEQVESKIRIGEKSGAFKNPDYINQLKEAVGNYHFVGVSPGVQSGVLSELVQKVEARGYLFYAESCLVSAGYKEAGSTITRYLNKDLFNILWEETFGTPEEVVQGVIKRMEAQDPLDTIRSKGSYWRETKIVNPGPPPDYIYDPGSCHGQIEQYLVNLGLGGATNEDKRKEIIDLAERMIKVTGMAAYYQGPLYDNPSDIANHGRLADEVIMEMVDARPVRVSGLNTPYFNRDANPEIRYIKNEEYWDLWWDLRRKNRIRPNIIVDPETTGLKSEGSNLRRIFYVPEDMAMTGNTRAESLRYAAESYVRSLPQFSGCKSLEEFVEVLITGKPTTGTFRYGGSVEKGAEVQSLMMALLNEPISGGEKAGDLSQLGNNLATLINTIKKFDEYLKAGVAPNTLYYATAHLMEATFKYINGNSKDRKKEFPRLPLFRPKTLNYIINDPAFYPYMDTEGKKHALGNLNASNFLVQAQEGRETAQGFLGDLIQALRKAFGQ